MDYNDKDLLNLITGKNKITYDDVTLPYVIEDFYEIGYGVCKAILDFTLLNNSSNIP